MKKTTYHTSQPSRRSFIRGFTLIEMLVVIAIIGILSGIIITNLSGAKGKARDAKRISDLGNIQMALELYFDRCNGYPWDQTYYNINGYFGVPVISGTGYVCPKNNASGQPYQITDFINPLPKPTGERSQPNYYYITSHPRGKPANDYILKALLESPNPAVIDGLDAGNLPTSWTSGYTDFLNTNPCSNHADSQVYCIGPK